MAEHKKKETKIYIKYNTIEYIQIYLYLVILGKNDKSFYIKLSKKVHKND